MSQVPRPPQPVSATQRTGTKQAAKASLCTGRWAGEIAAATGPIATPAAPATGATGIPKS